MTYDKHLTAHTKETIQLFRKLKALAKMAYWSTQFRYTYRCVIASHRRFIADLERDPESMLEEAKLYLHRMKHIGPDGEGHEAVKEIEAKIISDLVSGIKRARQDLGLPCA